MSKDSPPHVLDEPCLVYETSFQPLYFRTRNSNLRCFPSCGEFHMSKSFCGRPVEIRMKANPRYSPANVRLFSEIGLKESYSVGTTINAEDVAKQKKFKFARLGLKKNVDDFFIIESNRNWSVSIKQTTTEEIFASFFAYLVEGERIVEVLESAKFQICMMKKKKKKKTNLNNNTRAELYIAAAAAAASQEEDEEDDEQDEQQETILSPATSTSTLQRSTSSSSFGTTKQQQHDLQSNAHQFGRPSQYFFPRPPPLLVPSAPMPPIPFLRTTPTSSSSATTPSSELMDYQHQLHMADSHKRVNPFFTHYQHPPPVKAAKLLPYDLSLDSIFQPLSFEYYYNPQLFQARNNQKIMMEEAAKNKEQEEEAKKNMMKRN